MELWPFWSNIINTVTDNTIYYHKVSGYVSVLRVYVGNDPRLLTLQTLAQYL